VLSGPLQKNKERLEREKDRSRRRERREGAGVWRKMQKGKKEGEKKRKKIFCKERGQATVTKENFAEN